MAEIKHRCRALGCGAYVPTRLLMCLIHWRQVDAFLQRRVNKAFALFDQAQQCWPDRRDALDLRGDDLREAQHAAVLDVLGKDLGALGLDAPDWHRGGRAWDLATALSDQPVSRSLGLDRAPERAAYLATPAEPALCRSWLRRVQAALAERGHP